MHGPHTTPTSTRHTATRGSSDFVHTTPHIGGVHGRTAPEHIFRRFEQQRGDHHAGLFNVAKGVTLAAAGLALLRLTVEKPSMPRLLLLLIAVTGALLAYYGAVVGRTVVNFRLSLIDIGLPMAITVAELVLIARTASFPKGDGPHPLRTAMPADWFIELSVWQLLAGTMAGAVAARLDPSTYVRGLRPMVLRYRKRLWVDVRAATGQAAMTLLFWVWQRHSLPGMHWPEYAFVATTMVLYAAAIRHQGVTSREVEQLVTAAHRSTRFAPP